MSQRELNVLHQSAKNTAMSKKAFEIVGMASPEFHPVKLDLLTVKLFMIFCSAWAGIIGSMKVQLLERAELKSIDPLLWTCIVTAKSQSMMILKVS